MSPQRKAGTIFCETVLFSQDSWISFQKGLSDFFFWFSKDSRIRFSRTLELDGFTQEYGLVFRTLDWFFQNGQRIYIVLFVYLHKVPHIIFFF